MKKRSGGLAVVAITAFVALSIAGCACGDRRCCPHAVSCASKPSAGGPPAHALTVTSAAVICEYHEYIGGGSAVVRHATPVNLPLDTDIPIEGTAQAYMVRISTNTNPPEFYLYVGREVNAHPTRAEFRILSQAELTDPMFILHTGWVMGSDQWPRTNSPWVTISERINVGPLAGAKFGLHVQSPTILSLEKDRVFGMDAEPVPAKSLDIGANEKLLSKDQYAFEGFGGTLADPVAIPADSPEKIIYDRMEYLWGQINCKP